MPCEQLCTRGTSYKSFKITVDKHVVDLIFQPSLWPAEAIIDFYKKPKSDRRRLYQNNDYDSDYGNSDYYYQRKYRERVYDDDDFKGHGFTGRADTRSYKDTDYP